jgi:lauroyl/myristoyl acyltransferase
LYAGAALEGQRLLEQGRLVQFVSDVDASREGREVIVAGRIYALKPGFAELAVNTGAWVIPQFTTIRSSAHIHTTFLPPFTMEGGSREEKINSLLSQYAAFITYAWRTAPESLLWGKMARHFRQPRK